MKFEEQKERERMKFLDLYPEFAGSISVLESLKTCPSCAYIFNVWKKERQLVKEAIEKILKENCDEGEWQNQRYYFTRLEEELGLEE